MRLVVPEIEWRGLFSLGVHELNAVLLDEVAALHFRQHVQPLQNPVGFGDQRLADVESGEMFTFEELDLIAVLGDECRRGGSGGTTANHDNVGAGRNHLLSSFNN